LRRATIAFLVNRGIEMEEFDDQVETEIQKRVSDELQKRLNDPLVVINAYREQLTKVEAQRDKLIPKAIFYDKVTQSDDWMEMSKAVKSIDFAGEPIGRNKMFKILREAGILRGGGYNNNEPYQKYVDSGHFRIVETEWTNPEGETMIGRKTVVSQKGLDYIIKIINKVDNE